MTSYMLGLFMLSLLIPGIDVASMDADTQKLCKYLCNINQCPDSCRMQIGVKWSRRSLSSAFNLKRGVMESRREKRDQQVTTQKRLTIQPNVIDTMQ